MKLSNHFFLLAIFCAVLFNSCTDDQADFTETYEVSTLDQELSKKLLKYELVEINTKALFDQMKAQGNSEQELIIVPEKFVFQVSKSIENDIEFDELNEDGSITPMKDDFLFYDGINEQNEGYSAFSLERDYMYGEFEKENESYTLSKAKNFSSLADENTYVIYNNNDFIDSDISEESECLNMKSEFDNLEKNPNPTRRLRKASVLLIADYTFVNGRGSARAAKTYMRRALRWANNRYQRTPGMEARVKRATVHAQSYNGQDGLYDYYDTSTHVYHFRDYLAGRPGSRTDANILFSETMRNWGGALENSVCTVNAVGVVRYYRYDSRQNNILAHELGHILGSYHTYSGIMKAVTPSYPTGFDTTSRNLINNHTRNYGWCL